MTTHLITRAQFDLVRPLLENARKRTRPRRHDLYEVLCAILYRDHHGLTWRDLPAEFPAWRSVHEYQAMWRVNPPDGGPAMLERVCAILRPYLPSGTPV